jgi:hypothetical protein
MKREELIKDLQYCEDSMGKLGDRSDIWQDRMIYGLFKVVRDILLDSLKKTHKDIE